MKIYRFIPNTRDYRYVSRNLAGVKWWPDGIDLGRIPNNDFPKILPDATSRPWAHEGNQFDGIQDNLPFSDFPGLTLNVPILSERAARTFAALSTVDVAATLTVDGQRFFAVQPKAAKGAFQADRSAGFAMPEGEVPFYYQRSFDTSRISAEFFMIDELVPYSDLYITDRLVTAAAAAGLTGLEFIELVFDEDGSVVPTYPSVPRDQVHTLFKRGSMEAEMIFWRCSMWIYNTSEIDEACFELFSSGRVSLVDQPPTYKRPRGIDA
jgi:hypothetical protein